MPPGRPLSFATTCACPTHIRNPHAAPGSFVSGLAILAASDCKAATQVAPQPCAPQCMATVAAQPETRNDAEHVEGRHKPRSPTAARLKARPAIPSQILENVQPVGFPPGVCAKASRTQRGRNTEQHRPSTPPHTVETGIPARCITTLPADSSFSPRKAQAFPRFRGNECLSWPSPYSIIPNGYGHAIHSGGTRAA